MPSRLSRWISSSSSQTTIRRRGGKYTSSTSTVTAGRINVLLSTNSTTIKQQQLQRRLSSSHLNRRSRATESQQLCRRRQTHHPRSFYNKDNVIKFSIMRKLSTTFSTTNNINEEVNNNGGGSDYYDNWQEGEQRRYFSSSYSEEKEEKSLLNLLNDDENDVIAEIIQQERECQQEQQQQRQGRQISALALETLFRLDNNDSKKEMPSSTNLEELQTYYECVSQREHIQKYESFRKQATKRSGYNALPGIQRHVLNWYTPLSKLIEQEQVSFLKHNSSSSSKSPNKNSRTVGPYLCTVPSSKIAIITCHVALSSLLSGRSNCIPLSTLAQSIGDAIETEVQIQKILYKKYKQARKQQQHQQKAKKNAEEATTSSKNTNNDTTSQHHPPSWVYSEAQLERFITQVTSKKKINCRSMNWTQRRAVQLLKEDDNDDEDEVDGCDNEKENNNIAPLNWKRSHKVALGVTLIEMLLKEAIIDNYPTNYNNNRDALGILATPDNNERDEDDDDDINNSNKAFTYKKIYIGSGGNHNRFSRNGSDIGAYESLHLNTASTGGECFGCSSRNQFAHRKQGYVFINNYLIEQLQSDNYKSISPITDFYKPMVIPPKPWISIHSGAYKWLKTNFMRVEDTSRSSSNNSQQIQALKHSLPHLHKVYDGLNILGKVPWVINHTILDVAQYCWSNNIPLGDIPSRTDLHVPAILPKPRNYYKMKHNNENNNNKDENDNKTNNINDDEINHEQHQHEVQEEIQKEEVHAFKESYKKHIRTKQKNFDLNSLRCSLQLKLQQAEQFKSYRDGIYFPYNIDFRGRAYPLPPHLSTVGSDLCRGLLTFKEKKPLGQRGLYWLKVHLANLGGHDKTSFDDRVSYTDSNMDNIRAAVNNPFESNNNWWMTLDDPFQGLATCHEIINATDSGNPETYESSLPVHMDGSCNGLQHYAALGRDSIGGKAVNLLKGNKPSDVYIGVMKEVIKRVEDDYNKFNIDDGNDLIEALEKKNELTDEGAKLFQQYKSCKLVYGNIDRGVVKRTVMTSVYGVTFIGAKAQIKEKLEEKLEEQGHDIDEIENEINTACTYLAGLTMDVIGELFVGAKGTMDWLRTCASSIAQEGEPVSWITPLDMPVVQPYRQKKTYSVTTCLQSISIKDNSDDLPIHKMRQRSAFPPNYVHSLDASHMLLTAIEMNKRNLTFCAVHDSFWTHACDVDEMNIALRDTFVDLYERPILENLKESFELCYPNVSFPDLPPTGNLDISNVKKSTYFFQ